MSQSAIVVCTPACCYFEPCGARGESSALCVVARRPEQQPWALLGDEQPYTLEAGFARRGPSAVGGSEKDRLSPQIVPPHQ